MDHASIVNPVMLAKKYEPTKHKVIGWYLSEKLDGVRATWDGKNFITRNGNILNAPWRIIGALQKLQLGRTVLDGELYMGRGNFQECCGIVRRNEDEWIGIEFHVFDIIGSNEIFFKRYRALQDLAPRLPKFARIVDQESVVHVDDVWAKHEKLTSNGAEGVMLKNPASLYQHKRSSDLLKVKKFDECEAMVIGTTVGEGKYASCIGALICTLPNGKQFQCGSGLSDDQRYSNSWVGRKITVKYFELTKDGVPRFPIFKGIRTDA